MTKNHPTGDTTDEAKGGYTVEHQHGTPTLILGREDADPMATGITALRNAGLDPLRLWSLKAPKDAGGTVGAVFLQATSEVIILHQLASGRFVVFEKSSVDAISGGDVPELDPLSVFNK